MKKKNSRTFAFSESGQKATGDWFLFAWKLEHELDRMTENCRNLEKLLSEADEENEELAARLHDATDTLAKMKAIVADGGGGKGESEKQQDQP